MIYTITNIRICDALRKIFKRDHWILNKRRTIKTDGKIIITLWWYWTDSVIGTRLKDEIFWQKHIKPENDIWKKNHLIWYSYRITKFLLQEAFSSAVDYISRNSFTGKLASSLKSIWRNARSCRSKTSDSKLMKMVHCRCKIITQQKYETVLYSSKYLLRFL